MKTVQYPSQTREEPTALLALADVTLQPAAPVRRQFSIKVVRHVVGRPAMVEPEARSIQEAAHFAFDPISVRNGSTAHLARASQEDEATDRADGTEQNRSPGDDVGAARR